MSDATLVERLRERGQTFRRLMKDIGENDEATVFEEAADRIAALEAERDRWNADARSLSGGLLAIHAAAESVPASVLRSVAYDVALNCMDPDTAKFQIERRARALSSPQGGGA